MEPALLDLDDELALPVIPTRPCPRCADTMYPVESPAVSAWHCPACRWLALDREPGSLLDILGRSARS